MKNEYVRAFTLGCCYLANNPNGKAERRCEMRMDEEKPKKVETEEKKPAANDTPKGSEPKRLSLVEQADEVSKRLDQQLQELKTENQRVEENLARMALGGTTEGTAPVQKKTETDAEFAKRFLRGEVSPEEFAKE